MRTAKLERRTSETTVRISVNLDGQGNADIQCRPELVKHMLTAFTVHSGIDLQIQAEGDLQHHIIEDIALCLGRVIRECIDDIDEIARFGHALIPMDCSLALVAIDVCNRPNGVIDVGAVENRVEDAQVQDIVHFLGTLSSSLGATLHVKVLYGENDHHKLEAVFKALGRALRDALRLRGTNEVPSSSKGGLQL